MKGNSEVAVAQCDRIMAVWLKGLLEMMCTLAEMVSRTACQAEERTPDKEVHKGRHTLKRTTLLGMSSRDSSVKSIPQGRKSGCSRNWKKKCARGILQISPACPPRR
jgi:hypothetical protein